MIGGPRTMRAIGQPLRNHPTHIGGQTRRDTSGDNRIPSFAMPRVRKVPPSRAAQWSIHPYLPTTGKWCDHLGPWNQLTCTFFLGERQVAAFSIDWKEGVEFRARDLQRYIPSVTSLDDPRLITYAGGKLLGVKLLERGVVYAVRVGGPVFKDDVYTGQV